ncbi:MAG: enoyl-CoA hydratase-related protein [Gammaproteobacteria bacterium]
MDMEFIKIGQANGIGTLTLNRPDKRNAMHGLMVEEILKGLQFLAQAEAVHVVMINGSGENFCAGGDIAWMQKMAQGSEEENDEDAALLAEMVYQLYVFPKPTIALAHGATMGGGMGLVSACDIAIAANDSSFSLSEVKIGITPSVISPYVISAIGERAAHYYFLTGERFDADIARQIGLVHELTEPSALMSVGVELANKMLKNSPNAMFEAKILLKHVAKKEITEELVQQTAEHLAEMRKTEEALEGLKAFVEKRTPVW